MAPVAEHQEPKHHKLSHKPRSPKWSIGGKPPEPKVIQGPGPGHYSETHVESHKSERSKAFGFGTSPRDDTKVSNHPGPGNYSPAHPAHVSSKYSFGSSERTAPQQVEQPGPGAHEIPSHVGKAPKFSMPPRREASKKSLTPGPGTYAAPDMSVHKEKASEAYGFGSAPRDPSRDTGHPGPGAYQPQHPTHVSSKYGFGTADRTAAPAAAGAGVEQPGPGAYEAKPHVGSGGPAHSMAPRREAGRPSGSPGPGCYVTPDVSAHKEKKSAAHSFGTSPRDDTRDHGHPGPGSYRHDDRPRGPNYSMRPKSAVAKGVEGPGPGAYAHREGLGREGSQYTLGARRETSSKKLSPGPGAYSSADVSSHKERNSPKYGFGSSPKHAHPVNNHPGPGAYAHDVKVRGAQYGFGTGTREAAPRSDEGPGPGSYATKEHLGREGPGFSVSARRDAGPKPLSPGPGAHSVPDISVHKGKRSQAHGFGTSPRDPTRDLGGPGPGSYAHDSVHHAGVGVASPHFSMRGKAPPVAQVEHPGPGHYDH